MIPSKGILYCIDILAVPTFGNISLAGRTPLSGSRCAGVLVADGVLKSPEVGAVERAERFLFKQATLKILVQSL